MFHRGGRSIDALVSLLPKEHIWDVEGRVRGVSLGDSRFQFFFESAADLQKILNKRPCHFNKWSFALERWEPNCGTSFPENMTFWIKAEGLPAEFWEEAALTNFGNSIGVVRRVDTSKGRLQISVKADAPFRFTKNAQLPTGEIVKVKLFYEKLLRWCVHCRRICHEVDTCPLLDANQRAALVTEEKERFPRISSRGDGHSPFHSNPRDLTVSAHNNHGRNHRSLTRASQPPRRISPDKNSRKDTDRYAPTTSTLRLEGPRHSHHSQQSPRQSSQRVASDRVTNQARPPASDSLKHSSSPIVANVNTLDDGRKRRFEDSFSHEKSYEPSSKGRVGFSRKDQTSSLRHRDDQSGDQNSSPFSDSQVTISDNILAPPRAKQGNSSPAFVRERPFRLNLAKKSSALEKGKGKVGDQNLLLPEDFSETGSSAKKSLNFDSLPSAPADPSSPISLANLSIDPQTVVKKKSWYEETVEEEEGIARNLATGPATILAVKFSQAVSFYSPAVIPPPDIVSPTIVNHEDGWDKDHGLISEALNLDWTEEDEAAYHALEPPENPETNENDDELDDEFVDDDDLLGEELEDLEAIRLQKGLVLPNQVSPNNSKNSTRAEKRKEASGSSGAQELVTGVTDGGLGPVSPKPKKKDSKNKKFAAHVGRGQGNSGLLVNLASKKIHNIKRRSPSKRVSSKSGSLKPSSSRRPSSVPSKAFSRLRSSSLRLLLLVRWGPQTLPILTHEDSSLELSRGGC